MSKTTVKDREFILKNEKVNKALLVMVIPSVIAGAINQINVIIDVYFIGNFAHFSTEAQTATATSMTVIFIMNALSIMLAVSTAVRTSQLLGNGEKGKVQRFMANSFVAGWILYFLILIVLLPILPRFVELITDTQPGSIVYTNSLWYTGILLVGFPTIIFQQMSSQVIRAEGQAILIVKLSVIQVIINCIINYILISDTFSIVSFNATNYEAAAAGIGTVVSQGFMAIALLAVLFNKNKTNYYINLKHCKFSFEWLNSLKNGFPQLLANSFLALGTFAISISITLLAKREGFSVTQGVNLQAASGIAVRFILMLFTLINSGVQGVQGFVSYQYGSKSIARLRESLNLIRKTAFVLGLTLFFVIFLGARVIANLFSSDPNVIDLVEKSMRAFAITIIFFPTAHTLFGLFAAIGKPKLAMISTIMRDGILLSSTAFILPYLFGTYGVMLIMPTSLLIGSIIIITLGLRVVSNVEKIVNG